MSAGTFDPLSDADHVTGRTCEWCGSPMDHDGRAVCPSCGRLASRLAVMDEPDPAPTPTEPVAVPPAAAVAAAPPDPDPTGGPSDRTPAAASPTAEHPAPPPSGPRPRPRTAPPAPPAEPALPDPPASADGPVAPGGRWPTPAPLPPEDDEGRSWWKLAIPVVVVLVAIGVVAALTMGGGDDGGGAETATPASSAPAVGKVDLSDVDDPAVTTTRPAESTTTEAPTTTAPDGSAKRQPVASPSGISWTMAGTPESARLTKGSGRTWQDTVGNTTELVRLTDLPSDDFATSNGFDGTNEIEEFVAGFGADAPAVEASHIEDAAGVTASFRGTADGQPVVGYVVVAQVQGQSMLVAMWREGDDLDGLYLDWLRLPSSVTLP